MKKLVALSLVVLAILTVGLMVGCDKTTTGNNPGGKTPASIELRATHTEIKGFQGENRSEYITAIARDNFGAALPGVKIDFQIRNPLSYKGTIAKLAADTVSDENGEVHGTYSVVIQQSTDVVITALAGNITKEITIKVVESQSIIGTVGISIANEVLLVGPTQTRTTQFTATVSDTAGQAISGLQVHFRTAPSPDGRGVVDSDTGTTDFSGKVTRNFTSIVGGYGFCQIIGTVGTVSGSATIEIRQADNPRYLKLVADPAVVQVVPGTNATINLTATITDANRVGVPGTTVEFQVHRFPSDDIEGAPFFGAITSRDTTDGSGVVATTFNSLGGIGTLRIMCFVVPSNQDADPDLTPKDEVVIEVKPLANQIKTLSLRATPSFLSLPADSIGKSQIRAQVKDEQSIGIPNVQVKYEIRDDPNDSTEVPVGSLSYVTVTDSAGVSTAIFSNNYQTGTALIVATIAGFVDDEGNPVEETCTIQCDQQLNTTGSLAISSDRSFIYNDAGLTVATITATLKDQNDRAMVGKPVTFGASRGIINPEVITDTLGRAQAYFVADGRPSDKTWDGTDSVYIPIDVYAEYGAMHLKESVGVEIRDRNPVDHITLVSNRAQFLAGSSDSATVKATCFLADNDFAPAGTIVRFVVADANGTFTDEAVPVGSFGVATSYFMPPEFVGAAVLTASVVNPSDNSEVISNEITIQILAGPPSGIRLSATPNFLNTNDPGSFSTITATVTDTSGNPVRAGELVNFTTDKGDVTPSALTNDAGVATSRLTAGVESGVAIITAKVSVNGGEISATATVTFIAGYPNVIELSADPLQIAVAGTGGISTSTLRATVRDANGNPVERSTTVVFQLINNPAFPLGCNINNHGDMDSSRTANGLAVVSLNSGEQIGGKLVRAYTWRDPDSSNAGPDHLARTDTVSVILSTVAVVAGPPFQLDIDVNDDGDDAGGGAWQIPVSARVWDVHRNPVADRIPVVFTVDPQIATIDPGFTGNDIGQGVTIGIAYSWLRYHSVNTFDPITISAEVQAPDGLITGERAHTLPLQDGVLSLQVDPQNWMYDRGRANDTSLVRVWAILTDGHQITINNAPILFRTDRARFYWKNLRLNGRYIPFFPEPARRYTGLVNQENNEPRGQATVYLRGVMADFYLDDFTLEVTVHVEAAVEGYDVAADPAFIFCTRH